jgi:probable aminopeptidase NPEPL1
MPTTTRLALGTGSLASEGTLLVIGRRARLLALAPSLPVPGETWEAMVRTTQPGDFGASTSTWVGTRKVIAGVLPENCTRNNPPSRAWAIAGLAKGLGAGDATMVLALDDAEHALAAITHAARAFPTYSSRSGRDKARTVTVHCMAPVGTVTDGSLLIAAEGVRLAGRLVDMPPNELHTSAFIEEARQVAAMTGSDIEVIQGADLIEKGLGGLHGVGKAASHGPALVLLRHLPDNATRRVGWVGKGIVYDTGGLSIKGKDHMPGMKGDMGGAAAVLGAFAAAARTSNNVGIVAALCLAENSVGPEATRPDDILHMYSGKTVEVNNTDAEGRLVLADGVAWMSRNEEVTELWDLATLTGAALMTTGKQHCGVYTASETLESRAIAAGLRSGDPVFPHIYAPELMRKEYKSQVADMKNSVKDRMNAQASCAGLFIESHLPRTAPPWAHLDIAGPAWDANGRGTGFGVALLLELLNT